MGAAVGCAIVVSSSCVCVYCVYNINIYIYLKPRRFHPHETSLWRGVSIRLERTVYLVVVVVVVVGLCDLPYKAALFTGCSYIRDYDRCVDFPFPLLVSYIEISRMFTYIRTLGWSLQRCILYTYNISMMTK
jgi:hypothetical protein